MTTQKYNGWANYETWNVSLWLGNDEDYYDIAREFCKENAATKIRDLTYSNFVASNRGWLSAETPDGVSWTDPKLDHNALNRMIREMASDDFAEPEANAIRLG